MVNAKTFKKTLVVLTIVTSIPWLNGVAPVKVRARLNYGRVGEETSMTRRVFRGLFRPAAVSALRNDEPAEKVYKNIQVFKGLPSSRLIEVMFFMEGALGVSCNGCHVNFTDFEKDDNPNKKTARRMIEMVRALNQNNFGGKRSISCNTCHRGRVTPLAPLAFASIKDATTSHVTTAKSTQPPLTVDQIIERFVSATGGKPAQEKLRTSVFTGSMLSSESWTAPLKIFTTAPDKILVTFEIGWDSYQAFNGTKGWSQDNEGLHDVTGKDLALLKREVAFFRPALLKEQYSRLTLLGEEMVDDHEAYVVEGLLPGSEPERLYFDVVSGLLVRITSSTETILGTLPHQIDLQDYREADGVKLPFMVVSRASDFSFAYKLTEAKHNMPIESGMFDKPVAPLKGLPK